MKPNCHQSKNTPHLIFFKQHQRSTIAGKGYSVTFLLPVSITRKPNEAFTIHLRYPHLPNWPLSSSDTTTQQWLVYKRRFVRRVFIKWLPCMTECSNRKKRMGEWWQGLDIRQLDWIFHYVHISIVKHLNRGVVC